MNNQFELFLGLCSELGITHIQINKDKQGQEIIALTLADEVQYLSTWLHDQHKAPTYAKAAELYAAFKRLSGLPFGEWVVNVKHNYWELLGYYWYPAEPIYCPNPWGMTGFSSKAMKKLVESGCSDELVARWIDKEDPYLSDLVTEDMVASYLENEDDK